MVKKKKKDKVNFDKFSPVEILWIDSCDVGEDKVWHSDEEVSKIGTGFQIYTIGYIVSYDQETDIIRVCRSHSPLDKQQEGLFDIPLGCIKDIKILKGINKKKSKPEIQVEVEE